MRVWFGLVAVLALAAPALADESDLKQTQSDLTAQTEDKQRLDTQGAVKVELAQTRGWLGESANAVKEDKGKLARKLFDRVRAQLKMMDQRIALSQLQLELRKLEQGLQNAKNGLAKARKHLEDKRVQLKALKMTTGK
jgi:hypothetical protein